MPTAFFVKYPRRLEQLQRPFPLEQAREYRVSARVLLNAVDYGNFISDMLVERDYLEQALPQCGQEPEEGCVLVSWPGGKEGILVVPERGGFVRYAAWLGETEN